MKVKLIYFFLGLMALALWTQCNTYRRPNAPTRPSTGQRPGKTEPMDTVRWTTPSNPKPPIKNEPNGSGNNPRPNTGGSGDTYHIGMLLPFLTSQFDNSTVPEKSRLAVQFYAGAKVALQKLSQEEKVNLVVDVYDTQANDADFQKLLSDRRLAQSSVFIGPIRSTHVELMAAWAKQNRKILISPDSPSSGLTSKNPDFIQTNPSLRAHCEAISAYVCNKHRQDIVTLVCKQKEADRLPYFQDYAAAHGCGSFGELIVADATTNFDKTSFSPFFKPGKTAVFIMPSWASQDFVMAFFRKLKAVKGNNRVEVYGMPQWESYESIEPEYLTLLNVHISSESYIDYSAPEVKAFQQAFYEATGMIPDDDGFNGYDVTMFTGKMLSKYGLSFPEHLTQMPFHGLRSDISIGKVNPAAGADIGGKTYDYLENKYVHILKFGKSGYEPAE